MKTVTLTVSPNYVQHWGLWEALRELLQNMLDAKAKGYHGEAVDEVIDSTGTTALVIRNGGPSLDRKSLLFGQTTKAGDESQIGKFGEGFKLALLVLCRLGHQVNIITGNELWTPSLRHSDEFGCEVLVIDITETILQPEVAATDSVEFTIYGASKADIADKFRPDLPINRPIAELPGQVFVQGLYVCTTKGFVYGYNFGPGRVTLDRDRGVVDGFNLGYETAKIWTQVHKDEPDSEFGDDLVLKLIEKKAPDVEHIQYHVSRASKFETSLVTGYTRSYGTAIPVSTQAEIKQAVDAGVKFQLVPDSLKVILWRAVGYFFPTVGTPKQRLEAFIKKHQSSMTQSMLAELRDILSTWG